MSDEGNTRKYPLEFDYAVHLDNVSGVGETFYTNGFENTEALLEEINKEIAGTFDPEWQLGDPLLLVSFNPMRIKYVVDYRHCKPQA